MSARRTRPLATYRLQLAADQTFADAVRLVDHLAGMGISHLSLSPFLTGRPGSRRHDHVADHRQVDPVLGGEAGLRDLADAAHAAGVGLVGDLVAHHMAVGPWNPIWDALLREGRSSDAARVVDVDWETPLPGAQGKVVLPVLAAPYGDELAAGRLRLAETAVGMRITYGELSFPLDAESQEAAERAGGVERIEGRPGDARSWTRMHSLLEQQHYRLVSWRAGRRLVNYRRSLDADQLAAVRVEDPSVFELTHRVVLDLVADGVLDGLRIGSVAGMTDPTGYLVQLRGAVGPDTWLVVDQPASPDDPLPEGWPVDGTTGYELLRTSLGLQVDPRGLRHLRTVAAGHGGVVGPQEAWAVRMATLDDRLGPDLRRLVQVTWAASQDVTAVRDVDYRTLLDVLSKVLAAMPVARAHVDPEEGTASDHDRDVVGRAIARARRADGEGVVPDPLWRWLGDLLVGDVRWTAAAADAVTRFQQLSAALAVLAHQQRIAFRQAAMPAASELACDPDDVCVTPAAAHDLIAAMPPEGQRTTTTADTVHGEDVRMRLASLAGLAGPWTAVADALVTSTAPPDPALGLRLLATAVAVWPIQDDGTAPLAEVLDRPDLVDRLVAHGRTCARGQARVTSWTEPDEEVEGQLAGWVRSLLDPAGAIAGQLRPVALRAAEVGMAASLSQTLLRCAVPGVPDTHQGSERWDDHLCGPDLRRPVDHDRRIAAARRWAAAPPDAGDLWARRRDGEVKQWVLQQALRLRAAHPDVLGPTGRSAPLAVQGRWADHVLAVHRWAGPAGGTDVVAICPRLLGRVTDGGRFAPVGRIWADTAVALPPGVADGPGWTDVLTGRTLDDGGADGGGGLAEVLHALPVALLVRST